MSDEVLKYVKLTLSRIPKAIKSEDIEFDTLKSFDNSSLYTVYKKVPIKEIQILISDTDRTQDLKTRFKDALKIQDYIKENKENFEELAKKTSVEKIDAIEEEQTRFKKEIPFFLKYDKNYLWQIFYSTKSDKYFMLFPAKEGETECLFYLLKKKIEDSDDYIYVPICEMTVEKTFENETNKINDLENYIWSFTGNWPETMEYINEKQEKFFYIIGKTKTKEDLETKYRIQINNEAEFNEIFVLTKALFILTTETKNTYSITPGIDNNGSLIFYYNDEELSIANLKDFIASETTRQQNLKYDCKIKNESCQKNIEKTKQILKEQEKIYLDQERQILDFMNCRKSFFKKMRFYFTNNKKFIMDRKKTINKINNEVKKAEEEENQDLTSIMTTPDFAGISEIFTISDLIKTTNEANVEKTNLKNLEKDFNALKLKQKNTAKKIENADKYLDEIEKHKKNLLEFWRFTNKDNIKSLEEGEEDVKERKITYVFNYYDDLETLGAEVDSLQRKKLSNQETEAIFVAKYLLNGINSVITKSDTYLLDEEYSKLKEALSKTEENETTEEKLNELSYILGGIDDSTKIKELNHKKFRESKRNIYEILRFNETTTLEDFKDRMREIGKYVSEAYQKIISPYDMNVYFVKRNKGFIIGDLNPYKLLGKEDINKIYKMKANKETHMLFLSNCIYYNNLNQTLPLGMDEGTTIITKVGDNKKVGDTEVNMLFEKDEFNVEIRKIRIMKEEKR